MISGLLARTDAHEGEVLLDVELVAEVAFEIASAMVVESEERRQVMPIKGETLSTVERGVVQALGYLERRSDATWGRRTVTPSGRRC